MGEKTAAVYIRTCVLAIIQLTHNPAHTKYIMTCVNVSQEKTGLIILSRPLLLFVTIAKYNQTETVKKGDVEKGKLMLAISLLSSINLSKTTDMQLLRMIKHISQNIFWKFLSTNYEYFCHVAKPQFVHI